MSKFAFANAKLAAIAANKTPVELKVTLFTKEGIG